MHDIRTIRDDPESFAQGLKRRGIADAAAITDTLVRSDRELRALLTRLQEAQARRNEASKLIGRAKAAKNDAEANTLMAEVAGRKEEIQGVFVVAGGKAEFRKVETGITGATDIEVLSGLKDGEEIVTGSYQVIRTLRNQAQVKVDNKSPLPQKA